jgi:DnaJ family protein A protein 2
MRKKRKIYDQYGTEGLEGGGGGQSAEDVFSMFFGGGGGRGLRGGPQKGEDIAQHQSLPGGTSTARQSPHISRTSPVCRLRGAWRQRTEVMFRTVTDAVCAFS